MATQAFRAREEARVSLRECSECGVLGVPEGAIDADTSDMLNDTFPMLLLVPRVNHGLRPGHLELRCLECAG